jgi:acetyl esterase
VPDPDLVQLRRDARQRARRRPRLPFDGRVEDASPEDVPLRWYRPRVPRSADEAIVFLHGGYGVLGDLDTQDGYCRRLAGRLQVPVVSVAYRLAPEASLDDSADDVLAAVAMLRRSGSGRVHLCGDSAGGAVSLWCARRAVPEERRVDALLLTNPNIDLTLSRFDSSATDGPDRALSAWAFPRWARVDDLRRAPDLTRDVAGLPPTLVAVGTRDALLPEARALAGACAAEGARCQLVEVAGVGHGFMSNPDSPAGVEVIAAMRLFLA